MKPYSSAENVRAAVQATERYVAEHDPTFMLDLIAPFENAFGTGSISTEALFAAPYFNSSTVKRARLADVIRELYPDADKLRFPDYASRHGRRRANISASVLLYISRDNLLQYVSERTRKKQLVVVEFRKTSKQAKPVEVIAFPQTDN